MGSMIFASSICVRSASHLDGSALYDDEYPQRDFETLRAQYPHQDIHREPGHDRTSTPIGVLGLARRDLGCILSMNRREQSPALNEALLQFAPTLGGLKPVVGLKCSLVSHWVLNSLVLEYGQQSS